MKSTILKNLRTFELVKIIARNLLSVDQGNDDPLDFVVLLACECSSNLRLLSDLEIFRANFISPDAGAFDDLDAEDLNFHCDMVFLSGVRNGIVIEDEFRTLNLRAEAAMVLLSLNDDVVIVGKGRSGNRSVTLFSNKEAHTMSDNGQNCKDKPAVLEIQITLIKNPVLHTS